LNKDNPSPGLTATHTLRDRGEGIEPTPENLAIPVLTIPRFAIDDAHGVNPQYPHERPVSFSHLMRSIRMVVLPASPHPAPLQGR
jgi:hypothetical protein